MFGNSQRTDQKSCSFWLFGAAVINNTEQTLWQTYSLAVSTQKHN